MVTSEELRVAALERAAQRGKWVARRRIFSRWLGWVVWSIVLPIIGLAAVITTLACLAFWQYMGHDAAYAASQKWVQQQFGSFSTGLKTANTVNNQQQSNPNTTTMIPLTDEATPDLQIDRNLTIKNSP